MVDFEYKSHYDVDDLKKLVKVLRGPGGCPWDMEQTHDSITRDFLEEAYEVVEAIGENSREHLLEELGDVLLQVVFHADIEEDIGSFNLDDCADGVCKKLILRHPHVFGDVKVADSAEVLSNWDDIKRSEKQQETTSEAMGAVAKSLPGLWRAEKIQKKAAKDGFDWQDRLSVLDKLEEELSELRAAYEKGEGEKEELGDLLFTAVNYARFLDTDPEEAIGLSSDKFIARYAAMEKLAEKEGKTLRDMSLNDMDVLWNEVKKGL